MAPSLELKMAKEARTVATKVSLPLLDYFNIFPQWDSHLDCSGTQSDDSHRHATTKGQLIVQDRIRLNAIQARQR